MTKYLPSIVPVLMLVVTAVAQPVQNALASAAAHHPVVAMLVSAASVIAAHWLPSPKA